MIAVLFIEHQFIMKAIVVLHAVATKPLELILSIKKVCDLVWLQPTITKVKKQVKIKCEQKNISYLFQFDATLTNIIFDAVKRVTPWLRANATIYVKIYAAQW